MFPLNDANKGTNQRIRRLEHSFSLYTKVPDNKSFIDEVAYPQYRHTKHMLVCRDATTGLLSPITDYATMAAAPPTYGLLDLTSRNEEQVCTVFAMAQAVSWWLQAPTVLTPDAIYIHPAVDATTGNFHPLEVVVNNTKADSIGVITDTNVGNIGGTEATEVVWGSIVSDYYKDMIA